MVEESESKVCSIHDMALEGFTTRVTRLEDEDRIITTKIDTKISVKIFLSLIVVLCVILGFFGGMQFTTSRNISGVEKTVAVISADMTSATRTRLRLGARLDELIRAQLLDEKESTAFEVTQQNVLDQLEKIDRRIRTNEQSLTKIDMELNQRLMLLFEGLGEIKSSIVSVQGVITTIHKDDIRSGDLK